MEGCKTIKTTLLRSVLPLKTCTGKWSVQVKLVRDLWRLMRVEGYWGTRTKLSAMHNFFIQTLVFAISLKQEDHRRYPHEKNGFKPVSGMYIMYKAWTIPRICFREICMYKIIFHSYCLQFYYCCDLFWWRTLRIFSFDVEIWCLIVDVMKIVKILLWSLNVGRDCEVLEERWEKWYRVDDIESG